MRWRLYVSVPANETRALIWTWKLFQRKPVVGDTIIINDEEKEIKSVYWMAGTLFKNFRLIYWDGEKEEYDPEDDIEIDITVAA